MRIGTGKLVNEASINYPLNLGDFQQIWNADQRYAEAPEGFGAALFFEENREAAHCCHPPLKQLEGTGQGKRPGLHGPDRLDISLGIGEEIVANRLLVPF